MTALDTISRNRSIDRKELRQLVPLSPSHIYRLEKAGLFPKRIQLGPRRVAWRLWEVLEWIECKRQPAERNKSARLHVVPLNHLALETIRSLPCVHDELMFPARGKDNPVSGFSKWKRKLDEASGVRDWTLHDLRRTAATGMAALGGPPHVVELILNHRTGALGGIAGIYNRFQYLEERREALELWSQHLEGIIRTASSSAKKGERL